MLAIYEATAAQKKISLKLQSFEKTQESMSVRTISHTIESPGSLPVELVVTLPNDLESRKIPISVTLGFKTGQERQPMALACYHYAIPYRNKKEVVGTSLLDSNNDWIRDVTRQTATIIAKKFHKPCYVGWATSANNKHTSGVSMDQLFVIKECVAFLSKELHE